jgi:YidC/Oxa1 family membrane protein insertase
MIEWRCGFGDLTVATPACREDPVLRSGQQQAGGATAGNAKNGPLTDSGRFSFAGLEDAYFTAVVLPEGDANVQQVTFADTMHPCRKAGHLRRGRGFRGALNHFEMFVGPKDYDLLKRVDPKLEQVINFGWLSMLAKPLFLIVNWFNDNVVHNFGWAIVVVTIVINFMLFPLKLSNMKSMRKMQALKPQMDAINAKYKNIKMTDPRKRRTEPGGDGPYKEVRRESHGRLRSHAAADSVLLRVLRGLEVSVEMRGANWLWMTRSLAAGTHAHQASCPSS